MRIGVILVVAFFMSSCTKQFELNLMPAPEVYVEKAEAPVDSARILGVAVEREKASGMLYVTNRTPLDSAHEYPFFEDDNGYILHTGLGHIQFTDTALSVSDLAEASFTEDFKGKYQLVVEDVQHTGVIPGSAHPLIYPGDSPHREEGTDSVFLNILRRRVADSPDKSITVFTHGFRVGFTYPLLMASQFFYFDGAQETFIAYSWPSSSKHYLGYFKDSETAIASGHDFRRLLTYLAEYSGAKSINIIAHSAGTRVVLEAMNQLALMNRDLSNEEIAQKHKIDKVLLLSGDATVQQFMGHPQDNVFRMAQKVVVYQSEDDLALKTSRLLQRHRRIGQALSEDPPEPTDSLLIHSLKKLDTRLEVINATNAKGVSKGIGHSYFWTSPWVSSDLIMLLRYNLSAGERGLFYNDAWGTWEFSDEYPQMLQESLGTE